MPERHAAGVLIVMPHGGIVGFRRQGLSTDVGLPCGKVEPGESPAAAAVRETLEETTLHVEIITDSPAYVGYDVVGRSIVHTFPARIVGDEPDWNTLPPREGEGIPCLCGFTDLLNGSYSDYNRLALSALGAVEMRSAAGIFHAHFTLAGCTIADAETFAQAIDGKVTVIDLDERTAMIRDVMVTKYYAAGIGRPFASAGQVLDAVQGAAVAARSCGIRVERTKIERAVHRTDSVATLDALAHVAVYMEAHLKIVCSRATDDLRRLKRIVQDILTDFHLSANPAADLGLTTHQFITCRSRRGYSHVMLLVSEALTQLAGFAIEEVKIEAVVHDSSIE